jgi:hypothetical protein
MTSDSRLARLDPQPGGDEFVSSTVPPSQQVDLSPDAACVFVEEEGGRRQRA